jgi:serine/threonine protein kinase
VGRPGQLGAVKFFDPEIIEKHGAEIQVQRIEREKCLIGRTHPSLVQILDGGHWKEHDLHFVVMEYLPWKNLAEQLKEIPVSSVRPIIAQVASAARFLEEQGICHRDIKPENVAISPDFQQAKLLDLGVIRPHSTRPLTDGTGGKIFVGTLKYSPPEFLLREEQDTPDGWRAITFYQLGGVLHDLVMRHSLFADFENPFARLVNAVQHEIPKIESQSVSPALVELTRHCLLKPAGTRLQLVSWEDFEKEPSNLGDAAELKSKIVKRILARGVPQIDNVAASHAAGQRLDEYFTDLQGICRLECIENRSIFPPVEIFGLPKGPSGRQFVVQFDPSKTHGLLQFLRLELSVQWIDSASNISEVMGAAFLSSKPFSRNKPLAETPSVLYKGVYAPDSVRSCVVTALYRSLDAAQENSDSEIDKKHQKGVEFLHRLNLAEPRTE